jgi:hypothetical protein
MTVREMIEALQALNMPDAMVMRGKDGNFYQRGTGWDIVRVRPDEHRPNEWHPAADGVQGVVIR